MDNAFQYMDIIFLAVVAGVVLLRLRSVLGKRTGSEKKDPNLYSYDQPSAQPTEIKKPLKNIKYSTSILFSLIFGLSIYASSSGMTFQLIFQKID